jgi:hypothetical protein
VKRTADRSQAFKVFSMGLPVQERASVHGVLPSSTCHSRFTSSLGWHKPPLDQYVNSAIGTIITLTTRYGSHPCQVYLVHCPEAQGQERANDTCKERKASRRKEALYSLVHLISSLSRLLAAACVAVAVCWPILTPSDVSSNSPRTG